MPHPKPPGNTKAREEGSGNGGRRGSRCFHLSTASRDGGKTVPVNYIITAVSREQAGMQVAIVLLACCGAAAHCSLPPFFPQSYPIGASTFHVCSLHVCARRGCRGTWGTRKEGEGLREAAPALTGDATNYLGLSSCEQSSPQSPAIVGDSKGILLSTLLQAA